jgi:hypothetical protein
LQFLGAGNMPTEVRRRGHVTYLGLFDCQLLGGQEDHKSRTSGVDWLLNKQYVWGTRYVDELILRDNDLSNPPDGTLDYRHYALQDANFNVVAIVNNVGDVGRRFDYDAYGHSSTLNADFTPGAYEYDFEYRYAGYRWDYGCMSAFDFFSR